MKWKPTAAEKRAIRKYAALYEGKKPGAVVIEIGTRCPLTGEGEVSSNVLIVDRDANFDNTDLHQTSPWADLKYGIPLTGEGTALVDFHVYEKMFGDELGMLLTNVQAHVREEEGKAKLWKITGTGTPDALDGHLDRLLR